MKKSRIHLFLFILLLMLLVKANKAFASLEISEIMYDLSGTDTDLEWVEIHSAGEEIDLTDYKFYDGSNHGINPPGTNGGSGSIVIPSDGYVVLTANAIAFKSAHPNYLGTFLDTVMSLSNTSSTIKIISPSGQVVTSANYSSSMGANGDGNSLNKNGSTYYPAVETPGAQNSSYQNENSESEGSSIPEQEEVPDNSKFEILLSHENIYTKSPFVFNLDIRNDIGEKIFFGYFLWNFGDGNSLATNDNQPFKYQYDYPGVYLVTVEYSPYQYSSQAQIISRALEINVSDPMLVISKVGDVNDPFVEISNMSEKNIDISGYILKSSRKQMVFPKNSKIFAKSKIIVPSKVSKFELADISNLKLLFENQNIIYELNSTLVKKTPIVISSAKLSNNEKPKQEYVTNYNQNLVVKTASQNSVVNFNNTPAVISDIGKNSVGQVSSAIENIDNTSTNKNAKNILMLGMILLSGVCVIYLLRTSIVREKEEPSFIYDE